MSMEIRQGDALTLLRQMPDQSVQCCVTSPPYWGLRDYGVSGQLGLEPTPESYVAAMVEVFREVRRVLRDDGTLWLNLGDTYGATGNRNGLGGSSLEGSREYGRGCVGATKPLDGLSTGLKPKDLVGIPWRVAFALQADGWWLRSDVIWHKPNPMPESVTDRPTKAHEMLFLLAKSERYYYDSEAIREGVSEAGVVAGANGDGEGAAFGHDLRLQRSSATHAAVGVRLASAVLDFAQRQDDAGLLSLDSQVRQERVDRGASLPVVHVPVVRRAAAQAARFSDGDISAKEFLQEMHRLCVALPDGDDLKEAWRSTSLHVGHIDADGDRSVTVHDSSKVGKVERFHDSNYGSARVPLSRDNFARTTKEADVPGQSMRQHRTERKPTFGSGTRNRRSVWTVATQPFADAHFAVMPQALVEPCVLAGSRPGDLVLDPFSGSGTVGVVSLRHGRRFVGLELNPEYVAMARRRIAGPLFAEPVA